MFDWEDMRAFLTAAQSRSFAAAADRLAVDPATISRRIARLETSLHATLFTRAAGGRGLTATGIRVYEEARRAAAAMEAAAQAAAPDPSGGVVRLSVSEGFGTAIVAPQLAAMRRRRPNIQIELLATSALLSPMRYEADLAVTLSAPASDRLHVEPLSEYQLGLFASENYLLRRTRPQEAADLVGHDIVGYVEDHVYTPELKYLDEVHVGLRPTMSSSSIRAQQEMIASGAGIGVLPLFMAHGLTPVLASSVVLKRRFWVSTRLEVKDFQRIRVVRAWLSEIARAALHPRTPRSTDI